MRADFPVVLDSCVLIPMPLADTLLRMAEEPRLYLPKWSETIMGEVTRNLISKWNMAPEKARHREQELRRHFSEAWVEDLEPLLGAMTNDPADRHVLAAAVRSHAEVIVTYNRRHFPAECLRPWGVRVKAPSAFLRDLYDLDPGLFAHKLQQQATAIRVPLPRLLRALARNAPGFVGYFCEAQHLSIADETAGSI